LVRSADDDAAGRGAAPRGGAGLMPGLGTVCRLAAASCRRREALFYNACECVSPLLFIPPHS
jgi:hypothetical protein